MLKNKGVHVAVLLSLCWVWLPFIDAAAISNNKFVATLIALFVFIVIVGLQTIIIAKSLRLIKKLKFKNRVLELSTLFVLAAFVLWFLGWISTFIWYGEGASIDDVLPFTSITPFITHTPLKYLTQLFGFHGTTAVFAVLLYAMVKLKDRKLMAFIAVGLLTLNMGLWQIFKTPHGADIKVQISAQQLANPQHVESSADLLLLPEYGLDDITNDNLATRMSGSDSTVFIGSKQTYTAQGNQNTLLYGTIGQGITSERQKSRLIVGGEYLAYSVEPWLRLLSPDTVTNFEVSRKVIRGNDRVAPITTPSGLEVGAAVCSSILSTEDYRNLTNQGAVLLTNSASLEIFRGSRLFAVQHRGFAKFMAVANARPFAQSSNNWPAFALDHNGNQLAQIYPSSTLVVNLRSNTKKTPYTVLGEWPVMLGGLYLTAMFTIKLKKRFS